MTTPTTKRSLATLPKWAQTDIAVLKMRVRELREELALGPEESDTSARRMSDLEQPLGKGTHIRFAVTDNLFIEAYMNEGKLIVRSPDTIAVIPGASNVIAVEILRA